jgi:hypothetical protein
MSTPNFESVAVSAPTGPAPHRGLRRRLTSAIAAVVIVTGVSCTSAMLRDRSGENWNGPVGLPSADATDSHELDLKALRGHPRLLVDEAGWTVSTIINLAETAGFIEYVNRARGLMISWYPADQHDRYLSERLAGSRSEATIVAGAEATILTSESNDFVAILEPRDGTFAVLEPSGMSRGSFDDLLAQVVHLTPVKFLASLPPEVITPGEVHGTAAEFLTDVPIPPGFDVTSVDINWIDVASFHVADAHDAHYFGIEVTSQIACSWIAEWIRADAAADRTAAEAAIAALGGSRDWKILKRLSGKSNRPAAIWGYAEHIADGRVPADYRRDLGCAG